MLFMKSWLRLSELLELPQHYILLNFILIYELWLDTKF